MASRTRASANGPAQLAGTSWEAAPGGRSGSRGAMIPRPGVPRRRRRMGLLVLGVLLCTLGGLVGALLATSVGHKVAVLAIARPVTYGAVIQPADLAVARVAVDPTLSPIGAADRSSVVGKYATTDLHPGSLLTAGDVATSLLPGPSQELVGISLRASQLPNRPLHARDQVLIVSTPPQDADPPTSPPVSVTATVASVGAANEDGVRVVDVQVPTGSGAALVARAATGRVALVLVPPGVQTPGG